MPFWKTLASELVNRDLSTQVDLPHTASFLVIEDPNITEKQWKLNLPFLNLQLLELED